MNRFFGKVKRTVTSEGFTSGGLTALLLAALLFFNALAFALVNIFPGQLVWTPGVAGSLELSGATDGFFREAMERGDAVEVIFCMPEEELKTHTYGSLVHHTAKQLAERYPSFISLSYWNIITRVDQNGNRVDPTKYSKDEKGEQVPIHKDTVIFLDKGRRGDYRVVTDTYSGQGFADYYTLDSSSMPLAYIGEQVLSSMILWVLTDPAARKTAYFTTHHGESADIAFRTALATAGYRLDELDLRAGEIPEDASLIIISAPQSDFEQASVGSGVRTEMERLRDYVSGGGNLMISLHSQQKRGLPVLSAFMAEYGITVASSDFGGVRYNHILRDFDNAITADGFTLVADVAEGAVRDVYGTYTRGGVLLTQTAYLECTGGATALLYSSASARPEANGVVVGGTGVRTLAAYAQSAGGGHLLVVPSVYMSASDAMVAEGYGNRDFVYALLDVLFDAPYVPLGVAPLNLRSGILENLTMGTARIYSVIIALIPCAIVLTGVVILRRRKNR